MKRYRRSGMRWWQKPLVLYRGRHLPAELAVLNDSLAADEAGVWLNSRSVKTGVTDLIEVDAGKFETVRSELPSFVQSCLASFYAHPGLKKGVYDLVIWGEDETKVRFVEVKCPHWDRPTVEQRAFAELAAERGIPTDIVEWEFEDHHTP